MSADLARQIGALLENTQNSGVGEETTAANASRDIQACISNASQEERQQIAKYAKIQIRNRRGLRLQTCQIPIRPITPSTLLDSISWSISEPTSTASIYTDAFSEEDVSKRSHQSAFTKEDSKTSFTNLTRSLTESEKQELIFKNHFLTILFPIDRFSEMGPSSRTYFSHGGFTCLLVLDHIHSFYQVKLEFLSTELHELQQT